MKSTFLFLCFISNFSPRLFINKVASSRDLIIFMKSLISLFEIISKVIPDQKFLLMAVSVADADAINPNSIKGAMKLQPQIIFAPATKIGENTTSVLNYHFSGQIYTSVTKLTIYIYKNKFTSHKQHLFGLIFPRNPKKELLRQSILHVFLLCLKNKNDLQTFKCSNCKKLFLQCVCHCYNLLL